MIAHLNVTYFDNPHEWTWYGQWIYVANTKVERYFRNPKCVAKQNPAPVQLQQKIPVVLWQIKLQCFLKLTHHLGISFPLTWLNDI